MATFSVRDLRALSKPLLTLGIVGAIAAAAVWYSGKAVTGAQAEIKGEEAKRIEARNQIQRSGQEKSVIEHYIEPYRELERAGIVGEERRIGWIDAHLLASTLVSSAALWTTDTRLAGLAGDLRVSHSPA